MIAGNKSDMENQRRVDHKEAEQFAKQCRSEHFLVSAKSGANINELFGTLGQKIYELKKKKGETELVGSRRNPRIKVENETKTQKKQKKECCP